MTTYSHSKLGTFQQCKFKYKLQYIDKVKVDVPDTIETFMGKLVHETLEKLYKDLNYQKLNSKEELLQLFEERWKEEWDDKIIVAKEEYSADNYKEMGKKFVSDYYEHYKPFNQFTVIGLETQDLFELNNGRSYHVRIDRFCCDKEGNYYICDYKTNNQLKVQEELDEDRQLAMYSLWVKQKYPDAKSVKLMWYFLAFDKEMLSERSDEQLLKLQAETEALINEVERCTEFPTEASTLCSWCKFQQLCPAFKHKFELSELPAEKFTEDGGVKLVEEFATLDKQEKEAALKKEVIREKLIKFSQQKDVSVVWGKEHKVSVRIIDKIEYPKTEEFEKLLRIKGYDVFTINYSKFLSKILKREVDTDVLEKVKTSQTWVVKVGRR